MSLKEHLQGLSQTERTNYLYNCSVGVLKLMPAAKSVHYMCVSKPENQREDEGVYLIRMSCLCVCTSLSEWLHVLVLEWGGDKSIYVILSDNWLVGGKLKSTASGKQSFYISLSLCVCSQVFHMSVCRNMILFVCERESAYVCPRKIKTPPCL